MNPKRRIIPIFIPHKGCGHDCVFCDQHTISGMIFPSSAPDVSKAIREFEDSGDKSHPVEIAFYGGSFTAIPEQTQIDLLEAAGPLLALNPLNSIRISTRPDCIDSAIISRLKNYGVATIELGAQSMRDETLSASHRGHTALHVEQAAALVKSAGVSLILQMMTGLPGDTAEGALHTARQFIDLNPDGVRIYPTVVIYGTQLYEMWKRGEYLEHTVEEAIALCSQLVSMFENASIPVIRLGLNPSDGLSSGGVAAGAYHPAFGELVYSNLYYKKAASLLKGMNPGSDITIVVPKGRVSRMIGIGRQNIEKLKIDFSLRSIKVIESENGYRPGGSGIVLFLA